MHKKKTVLSLPFVLVYCSIIVLKTKLLSVYTSIHDNNIIIEYMYVL